MIFLLDSRWPDPCFIHFYEIKIYQDLWLGLPSIRINSPIHRTMEVPAKIRPQSVQLSGTTLNILPPKVTMRYCPARMSRATRPKPPMLAPMRAKALLCVLNALALNMFQNWRRTKTVKNRDSS